jgi:hypothetical protein
LHSALAALTPQDLIDFFESEGVATKVEETGKVFPVSDRASDVLDALVRRLARSGCTLALDEPLVDVELSVEGGLRLTTSKRTLHAAKLLVTTGGQSYPGCGTNGDGYRWAARLGHAIVPPRPALTPITTDAAWVRTLQGVTVADVGVAVVESADHRANEHAVGRSSAVRPLAERRGSFLFTHFGLSGPAVLDVSGVVSGHAQPRDLVLRCDFLPALAAPALDDLLRRAAAAAGGRQIAGLLANHLPRRLGEALLAEAGLSSERRAAELSRAERARWVAAIKGSPIAVSGTRGFKKAEVTAGGVSLDEVDSHTMQSRLVPNLYLAGEVLDLDGPIGGFNFQAAFSTGWLAAESV